MIKDAYAYVKLPVPGIEDELVKELLADAIDRLAEGNPIVNDVRYDSQTVTDQLGEEPDYIIHTAYFAVDMPD